MGIVLAPVPEMPLQALTILLLTSGIAISGALAVWGQYSVSRRYLVFALKPLTTALICGMAVLPARAIGGRYGWAIVTGLLFSLAGDVFLMLPKDHFRDGLAAFLLAHICYLIAFTSDTPFLAARLPFLGWLALGAALLRFLWPGIPPGLRLPVGAYVLILLCMAAQANARAIRLPSTSALLASAGGVLFVLSDGLLALDRFRTRFRSARALVQITYFVAQWLMAASAYRFE
jgi:uncharacterized membrane protein YhhN